MENIITELYQGVKFSHTQISRSFHYDHRLELLNRWVYLFTELGLAPLHSSGAYGNQSYRTSDSSFVITRSGMSPQNSLDVENYVYIKGFDDISGTFTTEGISPPSSESFLHYVLYKSKPHIHSIMHGHSSLLCSYAKHLKIPVTEHYHDYGTPELAEAALQISEGPIDFFVLKDHGFVALGKDIKTAGELTLDYYLKLITLLRNN